MCVSIPGRVTALHAGRAELDVLGAQRVAGTGLVPEVQVGDYVLTSAGMIVAIVSEEEALASIGLFRDMLALDEFTFENPPGD